MQTIQLEYQVDSDIYEQFIKRGQEIKDKIREFLIFELNIDDGYPTIGTEEAKKRVARAVEEYQNGTGIYLSENEYQQRMDKFINRLELQYGNN